MIDTFLVAGSINIDYNIRVNSLPKPGETVTGTSFSRSFGGKGANQAVALSRLLAGSGRTVCFSGQTGDDDDGRRATENLCENGIDISRISKSALPTGMALIEIDEKANNRIVVVPGANGNCDRLWAQRLCTSLLDTFPDPTRLCCLLQLEIPTGAVAELLETLHTAGAYTILDPAPAIPLDDHFWPHIDLATPNQSETEKLTGIFPEDDASACRAADIILSRGAGSVIIKAGETGSWYFNDTERIFCPSFSVKAIDTTAAGDVYNAAFAAAMAMKLPTDEALRYANAAGALSVTGEGAQGAMPDSCTVEALLRAEPKTAPCRLK